MKRLNEDGICEDIDECLVDNWCQHECRNTIGGWECLCPEGKVLRDDGKTCGIQCYHCENAATNAECNAQPMETCSPDADSCQNEVRIHHGIKRIFKRCKQSLACQNNYIQNPPPFLAPPGIFQNRVSATTIEKWLKAGVVWFWFFDKSLWSKSWFWFLISRENDFDWFCTPSVGVKINFRK